jgi:hypothetical protein
LNLDAESFPGDHLFDVEGCMRSRPSRRGKPVTFFVSSRRRSQFLPAAQDARATYT